MIALWLMVACVPTSLWEGQCRLLGGQPNRGQCDDTGGSGGGSDSSDGDTTTTTTSEAEVALVFHTDASLDGDLQALGFAAGALGNADFVCQREADQAGVPGTFKAWLSTPNKDAIDHIEGEGPWYIGRRSGSSVFYDLAFEDRADLELAPLVSIARNAQGDLIQEAVWTGTGPGGTYEDSCNGFTATDEPGDSGSSERLQGVVGSIFDPLRWTAEGRDDCRERHGLYCFSDQ